MSRVQLSSSAPPLPSRTPPTSEWSTELSHPRSTLSSHTVRRTPTHLRPPPLTPPPHTHTSSVTACDSPKTNHTPFVGPRALPPHFTSTPTPPLRVTLRLLRPSITRPSASAPRGSSGAWRARSARSLSGGTTRSPWEPTAPSTRGATVGSGSSGTGRRRVSRRQPASTQSRGSPYAWPRAGGATRCASSRMAQCSRGAPPRAGSSGTPSG